MINIIRLYKLTICSLLNISCCFVSFNLFVSECPCDNNNIVDS